MTHLLLRGVLALDFLCWFQVTMYIQSETTSLYLSDINSQVCTGLCQRKLKSYMFRSGTGYSAVRGRTQIGRSRKISLEVLASVLFCN